MPDPGARALPAASPVALAALRRHPLPRFVLVGALTGVLHLGGFLLLRGWWDPVPANAAALAVATVVNTEANRRFSFVGRKRDPVWRQHLNAGIALLTSLGVAAAALAAVEPTHRAAELALVVLADGAAAAVRFVLLRYWVFRTTAGGPPCSG